MKGTILKGRSQDGTRDVYKLNFNLDSKWDTVYLTKSKPGVVNKWGEESLYFFDTEYKKNQQNESESATEKKGEFVDTVDKPLNDDIPF
jgi:hypothetical protein